MEGMKRHFFMVSAISLLLVILFQGNCTKSGVVNGGQRELDRETTTAVDTVHEYQDQPGEQVKQFYDLEEEMLEEDDTVRPEELEEKIGPLTPDSIIVKDLSAEAPATIEYDLGYRIQIFASSELDSAGEIKMRAASETGYSAYIEYEGGLYKVRVGNFEDRISAAEARSKLVEFYPDCWIVKTTIRR